MTHSLPLLEFYFPVLVIYFWWRLKVWPSEIRSLLNSKDKSMMSKDAKWFTNIESLYWNSISHRTFTKHHFYLSKHTHINAAQIQCKHLTSYVDARWKLGFRAQQGFFFSFDSWFGIGITTEKKTWKNTLPCLHISKKYPASLILWHYLIPTVGWNIIKC